MARTDKALHLTDQDREEMLAQHPVIAKEYTVLTPMITETYIRLRDRVWMRRTGTVMYAETRIGKTTCLDSVEVFLKKDFPEVFIVSFIADDGRRSTSPNSGAMKDILDAIGIRDPKKKETKEHIRDLVAYVSVNLAGRSAKQFVLLIDEMQLLSRTDFTALLVVHNRLKKLKIAMSTIGFAQPEILNTLATFRSANADQLIARFLHEPIQFSGCLSEGDLRVILVAYDFEKHYPDDSDWTYTRFFFPKAFSAGLRISDYCTEIWEALLKAATPSANSSVRMENVSATIEYLLAANRKYDENSFRFSDEMIEAAVEASGIIGH